jgi:hypothetical protein
VPYRPYAGKFFRFTLRSDGGNNGSGAEQRRQSSSAASKLQETLQVDVYDGYAPGCRGNDITRLGCWAHARRRIAGIRAISFICPNRVEKAVIKIFNTKKDYWGSFISSYAGWSSKKVREQALKLEILNDNVSELAEMIVEKYELRKGIEISSLSPSEA